MNNIESHGIIYTNQVMSLHNMSQSTFFEYQLFMIISH